jgi:hypothetical protein
MRILGYSERGIINALFYEIQKSENAENLFEGIAQRSRRLNANPFAFKHN